MIIVWDEAKRDTNLRVHGLDFAAVEDGFDWAGAVIVATYPSTKSTPPRLQAVGFLDTRLVSLVFSPLGAEAISLVSLRPAGRKEKKLHAQR